VIDWLKAASMTAVARNMGLSRDQVNGVQERAVARGLARREAVAPAKIGVDETSFQKRHEYVTIVTDLEGSRVLHVADGRGKASLNAFFEQLDDKKLASIEVVAMDMHMPFILSAAEHIPDLESKLCFDRFHVAQLFSRAVDEIRRAESKRLAKEGDESLKRTRYIWLKSKKGLPRKVRQRLAALLETGTLVGEVWAVKEAAANLWHYKSRTWAEKAWLQLCKAALALNISALTKAVDTVLRHFLGIINAVILRATNAASESVNSRVQALKRRANGYHNRARFRDAIMFHLGGLDLYPIPATPHETQ
jgi:transposase